MTHTCTCIFDCCAWVRKELSMPPCLQPWRCSVSLSQTARQTPKRRGRCGYWQRSGAGSSGRQQHRRPRRTRRQAARRCTGGLRSTGRVLLVILSIPNYPPNSHIFTIN